MYGVVQGAYSAYVVLQTRVVFMLEWRKTSLVNNINILVILNSSRKLFTNDWQLINLGVGYVFCCAFCILVLGKGTAELG
jgi:hypothetical protein